MGQNCELPYNACALLPCQNNGTCIPKPDGKSYYCECADPGKAKIILFKKSNFKNLFFIVYIFYTEDIIKNCLISHPTHFMTKKRTRYGLL